MDAIMDLMMNTLHICVIRQIKLNILNKMDANPRVRHGSLGSDTGSSHQDVSGSRNTCSQENSSTYLAVAMRNIIQSTLTHDDLVREPLKPWRKRIRDLCSDLNTNILEAILNDTLPTRYNEFISDKNETLTSTEPEVEEDYTQLCLDNKAVLDKYLLSMGQMFESYKKVEEKITELEELEHEFVALSFLDKDDGSTEFSKLQGAIQDFIQKRYQESKIADDFNEFKHHYKTWKTLRAVVLQAHIAQDIQGGPFCSICTSERINTTLIPCGHTYCNSCGQKQKSACFICRTTVKERLKIFFT
jgi:hypothetical protein